MTEAEDPGASAQSEYRGATALAPGSSALFVGQSAWALPDTRVVSRTP